MSRLSSRGLLVSFLLGMSVMTHHLTLAAGKGNHLFDKTKMQKKGRQLQDAASDGLDPDLELIQ